MGRSQIKPPVIKQKNKITGSVQNKIISVCESAIGQPMTIMV